MRRRVTRGWKAVSDEGLSILVVSRTRSPALASNRSPPLSPSRARGNLARATGDTDMTKTISSDS